MRSPLLPALAVLAVLASAPAQATMERARAAEARGDLRTAQIELRNAARSRPEDAAVRAALAVVSLELGDPDTADREARAALAAGFDRAAGTALRVRAMLGLNRARDLLREMPEPDAGTQADVAAQILAGRALAHLLLDQHPEARRVAEAAVARGPRVPEALLALSAVRVESNDLPGAQQAVAAALEADPRHLPALTRQAGILFGQGNVQGAAEMLTRALEVSPGNPLARVQRAETRLRLRDRDGARGDAEVALRNAPGLPAGHYIQSLLLADAGDWRGADEALSRVGQANIGQLAEGLLLQANIKARLGQDAQAEEAATRLVARRPLDGRGVVILAALQARRGAEREATDTLADYQRRGGRDAEALVALADVRTRQNRRRDAEETLRLAAEASPRNGPVQSRLAAARLALGDLEGMTAAAEAAVAAGGEVPVARQLLALAAVSRGDADRAERELSQLPEEARRSEPALLARSAVQALRLDFDGARRLVEEALAGNPESVAARLALLRYAAGPDRQAQVMRLLGEVLQRDPENAAALGTLAGMRGAPAAVEMLRAANRANPGSVPLAATTARALLAASQAEEAARVLAAEQLAPHARTRQLRLLAIETRAALGQWPEAEAAARIALTEEGANNAARIQLALLLARRGEAAEAQSVLDEGLRAAPGDLQLMSAAVVVAQRAGGPEGALAAAERLSRREGALPAGAFLRGDLLMALNRPAEAAQSFAPFLRDAPSEALAVRLAQAQLAANQGSEARATLSAWLAREPASVGALTALARVELAAGRSDEAQRALEGVIRAAPNNGVALNDLAWLLAERGDPEALARARPLAERAFFLLPRAETADTLGWVLTRGGEAPRAVEVLRAAFPGGAAPTPGMAYRMAAALAAAGDRDAARQQLDTALRTETFPERTEAERLRARLSAGG